MTYFSFAIVGSYFCSGVDLLMLTYKRLTKVAEIRSHATQFCFGRNNTEFVRTVDLQQL